VKTGKERVQKARDLLDDAIEMLVDEEIARLRQDSSTMVRDLRELVRHCWVHSNYVDCGYKHMTGEQKRLYCDIIGRSAQRDEKRDGGDGNG